MTDERKNEIWAMLDADAQELIKGEYEEILEDIADYKEQNTDNGSPIMENRAIGQKQMLIRLFGKHNLTAQAEEKPKAKGFPILSGSLQASVDWNSYRLDLAKEIAVAMINEDWPSVSVTATAIDAVDMANEIVKQLKETEI